MRTIFFLLFLSCGLWSRAQQTGTETNFDRIYRQEETHEAPCYPGGQAGMMQFLRENVKYPASAMEKNIQGKVFVEFVVEKNGKVSQVTVIKGVHPDLDQEALRVVAVFPDWEPGHVQGKAVRTRIILPVHFKIRENEKQK